jgi:DNA-binding CsgD family transcriptional regulator
VSAIYRRAGDAFLKERDSRGRAWGRAFLRRYVELTPAIPLVAAHPGLKILATRFALTQPDDELHRTPFYLEVMQPQGWRHGAVLCFWTEPSDAFPILVLSLYRGEGRPDFSDCELAELEKLHPFLAPAVLRLHQMSSSTAVSDGLAASLRHAGAGVVVLDRNLRVARANVAGRKACAAWTRPPGRQPAAKSGTINVPAPLLAVCEALRLEVQSAMRRNPDADAERRRQVANSLSDLSACVTARCHAAAMAEPSFMIEFASVSRHETTCGSPPEWLSRLTPSERDVAQMISEGLSNDEAAERLGKTIHAVKFQLHRIYRKLGVANRSRLALLFGRAAPATSPS